MKIIHCIYPLKNSVLMKATLMVVLFTFLPVTVKAQAPFPDKDEIEQFTASKTCVVLEDDLLSSYNVYIKKAIETYWTITPYEFIDVSEFNVRRLNPEYSFIVLTQTSYENDKSHDQYNFINLLQGKHVSKLGEMPEICAVPLSYSGENDFDYSYKLGAILLFMQKHAGMISEDPSLTGRKYLKYYNRYTPEIHDKTILVKKEDLSPEISTIDKIKAIYTHSIKIVSENDIEKAIREKTPGTVILHLVGPANNRNRGICFKMLIGTDDSNMYYYSQQKINKNNPDGLLPEDLKRFEK
jgi:hypothetical protein